MISAEAFDEWRVIPRLLTLGYGLFAFYTGDWFMALTDPSAPQAAFVSTVWGGAVGWFGFYTKTGRKAAE